MKLPVVGGSYDDVTSVFSSQISTNCYVEAGNATTRTPAKLRSSAGLKVFAVIPVKPVRRLHVMRGELFAVAFDRFFSIDSLGAVVEKGTLDSSGGRVSMADNGDQLVIVDGAKGYIYTKSTDVFAEITDPDFLPATHVEYLDGFFIFVRTNSEVWFLSDLLDGTQFNPLERAANVQAPDNTVGLLADHGELWFFGEDNSTEVWGNTGNILFPFEPIQGASIERGCAAGFTPAKDDNTVFWLGEDKIVYTATGFTPTRISHHALEERISSFDTVADAWGTTYTENGHKFYVLHFPSAGETWLYDMTVGDPTYAWHQRESISTDGWRVSDIAVAYGKTLVGDSITGNIGELDLSNYTEYGDPIIGLRRTATINAEQRPFIIDRLELVTDPGIATTNDNGDSGFDPEVGLRISEDGGRTFGFMSSRKLGKLGEYRTRPIWRVLGQHVNSVFEFTFSSPNRWAVIECVLEGEPTDLV